MCASSDRRDWARRRAHRFRAAGRCAGGRARDAAAFRAPLRRLPDEEQQQPQRRGARHAPREAAGGAARGRRRERPARTRPARARPAPAARAPPRARARSVRARAAPACAWRPPRRARGAEGAASPRGRRGRAARAAGPRAPRPLPARPAAQPPHQERPEHEAAHQHHERRLPLDLGGRHQAELRADGRPAIRRPARGRAARGARARGRRAACRARAAAIALPRPPARRRARSVQREGAAGGERQQRPQPHQPVDAAQRRLEAHELAVGVLEVGEDLLLVVARASSSCTWALMLTAIVAGESATDSPWHTGQRSSAATSSVRASSAAPASGVPRGAPTTCEGSLPAGCVLRGGAALQQRHGRDEQRRRRRSRLEAASRRDPACRSFGLERLARRAARCAWRRSSLRRR